MAASMPAVSALKKRGAVGRGGDLMGEARWSVCLPWRRKEGSGEVGTAACATPDRVGGSVLLDRRKEKAGWAF
jgi:hypothetical protein